MKLTKSLMFYTFRESFNLYQQNYKALFLYRNQLDGWVVTVYTNQIRPLTNYLGRLF